jgi:hypothetical protein
MNGQLFPFALQALVPWTALLAKEEDLPAEDNPAGSSKKEQAIEILALVIHHPATLGLSKDKAARLLGELEAELPPEVVAAAQERGKTRQLEEVVGEILEKND